MAASIYVPELRSPYVLATNTIYQTLSLPLMLTGTGNPTTTAFRSTLYAYTFSTNQVNSLQSSFRVPNDWKTGTDITPRIEFTTTGTGVNKVVRWGVEYSVASIDAAFPVSTTTTLNYNIGATSRQYVRMVATMTPIPAASLTTNSMVSIRVFREGNNAADTFASTTMLLSFNMSYVTDALGSKQVDSK